MALVFLGHFYVYAPARGVLVLLAVWLGLISATVGLGLLLIAVAWIYGLSSSLRRASRINSELAATA